MIVDPENILVQVDKALEKGEEGWPVEVGEVYFFQYSDRNSGNCKVLSVTPFGVAVRSEYNDVFFPWSSCPNFILLDKKEKAAFISILKKKGRDKCDFTLETFVTIVLNGGHVRGIIKLVSQFGVRLTNIGGNFFFREFSASKIIFCPWSQIISIIV